MKLASFVHMNVSTFFHF